MGRLDFTIHFFGPRDFAVESTPLSETTRPLELVATASFILRQLANLGRGTAANDLASILLNLRGQEREVLLGECARVQAARLFTGQRGDRRFEAAVEWDGKIARLQLHPRGFGWFDSSIESYSLVSVVALLRYFVERRALDEPYVDCIGTTAHACGGLFTNGELTVANQGALASQLALVVAPYLRDATRGSEPVDRRQGSLPVGSGARIDAQKREFVLFRLSERARALSAADLAAYFAAEQPVLTLGSLHPVTRRALRETADGEASWFGGWVDLNQKPPPFALHWEVMQSLFCGYLVARCVLGTHDKQVQFPANPAEGWAIATEVVRRQPDYPADKAVAAMGSAVQVILVDFAGAMAERPYFSSFSPAQQIVLSQLMIVTKGFMLALIEAELVM